MNLRWRKFLLSHVTAADVEMILCHASQGLTNWSWGYSNLPQHIMSNTDTSWTEATPLLSMQDQPFSASMSAPKISRPQGSERSMLPNTPINTTQMWIQPKIRMIVCTGFGEWMLKWDCLLHQSLVSSLDVNTGSVWKVISSWTCVESVVQVIFNMQGVAMSNLLPSVICIEWSILGRISWRVAMS